MTITTDLSTDLGQLRMELGDDTEGSGILPTGANFSDAQLQLWLDREAGEDATTSLMRAVAAVCEALAVRYSRLVDISVGPRRQNLSQIADGYRKRAESLRQQYGGAGEGASSSGVIRVDGFSDDIASDAVESTGSDYRQ